jgi:hypothetical protein
LSPLNTLRHQGRPPLFVVDFRITPSCARRTLRPTNRNISADFATQYQEATETDNVPSPTIETHCKRELMQVVWSHIMDEDFVKGCTDGMTIQCSDGLEQVFFLHIMTYSADYPEK